VQKHPAVPHTHMQTPHKQEQQQQQQQLCGQLALGVQ
jgi:hypothetical protein